MATSRARDFWPVLRAMRNVFLYTRLKKSGVWDRERRNEAITVCCFGSVSALNTMRPPPKMMYKMGEDLLIIFPTLNEAVARQFPHCRCR